jgi:two-component system, sensor histidine kinase YesM
MFDLASLKKKFLSLLLRAFTLKQKSIQSKLLGTYIIINLVPLIIVGVISYTVSSNAIRGEIEKNNTQLIEEVNHNISLYLQDLLQLSNIYVSTVHYKSINSMEALNKGINLNDLDVLENLMRMNEYLNTTYNSSDTFLSIRLFSDKGVFLSSAFNMQAYQLYNYNSPEEIQWQKKMYANKTNALIFDVHPLDKNGAYSFVASRAATNPYTNKRYGYICYDKQFSSFVNIFKQFENREGSEIQVIKNDGTIVYHTHQTLIGSKADLEILELIKNSSSRSIVKKVNYRKMLITYDRLPYGGLTVVGSVPVNVFMKHILPIQNVIFIICIISLLLVIILSLILSFHIAKPIKKLSNLMTQVELGNFDVAIEEIDQGDEIGHLSKSFNSMVSTIRQLIKSGYEMKLRNKDAELKALLMQINPHFLYNTLEVISGMADCEGVESISDITQSLSKMLRYNIDLQTDKVRLVDEIENCKNFFLILKSRFEDNLTIETEFDAAAGQYLIVKLVLQPLIENSIKHGIEKKLGKGYIKLTTKKLDDEVLIQITDNGVGFNPERLAEFKQFMQQVSSSFYDSSTTKSLGLKNVYARLKIFFGDKLRFEIQSHPEEGTIISIFIPALTYND